jgi:hypothetical protein
VYHKGASLSSDFRQLLIDNLIKNRANAVTGDVPRGLYSALGRSHRVSRTAVRSVWLKYCEDGLYEPRPKKGVGAGRQRKLNDGDLVFVQSILKEKPSTSYSEIADKLEQYSATGRVSKQCLSHSVRNYLPSGNFLFKRITRQMGDKYNQNNMNYYQHFVNYVSQMDPSKCKYFDESGFKLTTAHRNYGHGLDGEKCVEVGRLVDNPNTTLNLLVHVSINGINHFNFVDGASKTDTFVNFFFEAANSVSENGFPARAWRLGNC